jgi:hypothetical protein
LDQALANCCVKSARRPYAMNEPRIRRLIDKSISTFGLDLTGVVILTEAATGYYILTPMIAAIAGAEKVLAITRDSRFGHAVYVQRTTEALARKWNVEDRIEVIFSRKDESICEVDIVTNLGFVRPLNATFLNRLKSTTVITLMWETQEYRPEDLDLHECRRLRIPVLGTNEHHSDLRTFEYIGHIALKLLLKLEIEIFRSNVVVIGSGEFLDQTVATLHNAGAYVTSLNTEKKGVLRSIVAKKALQHADAMVVVEQNSRRVLIGPNGEIGTDELYDLNPCLVLAHVCGGVDRAAIESIGLPCYPETFAMPGYMSVATDYLGPKPLIDLHTAGLKVGERLAYARKRGLAGLEAELAVLKETSLAQGFSGYHNSMR